MPEEGTKRRLVVVSNRLPFVVSRDEHGDSCLAPGSGGLVTALAPVLRNRGGVWIGWPGTTSEENIDVGKLLASAVRQYGYRLKPVELSAQEVEEYYRGFSNEVVWPLFHDFTSMANFAPIYWTAYQSVNAKFARVIADNLRPRDFVWIHDYQLMLVARELRALGVAESLAFFLHIPFPPLDIFLRMPWRFPVLRALCDYDLIGFQTLRDRRNFLQCVRVLVKDTAVLGHGQVVGVRIGERQIRVGVFPIGIDFDGFARDAASTEVSDLAWYLHEHFPSRHLLLGVDRLDYSKGLPLKFFAFENALERYPDLRGNITLIQVVVPSREEVPRYQELKLEIEQLVGRINGRFAQAGWTPIHYVYRNLPRPELLAHYRACETALVTPLKDGMNLVAKEYCAASVEEHNGVLILSEFAGAVAQLQRSALLVNPNDIVGVADAIYRSVTMDREERRQRMHWLRQVVRRYNVFWWVDSFLKAAIARDLRDFPVIEDYVPQAEPSQEWDAQTEPSREWDGNQ